jgi:hypothetical protein
MHFIYANSNLSGIGDRICDIILIFTYAKYINCDYLYVAWRNCVNDDSIYNKMRKEKTPFREKDIKHVLDYILFPDDIKFIDEEMLDNLKMNNYVFDEYIGVKYSVFDFIDKYLPHESDNNKNNFINSYYKNFEQLIFKNIPNYVIDTFKNKNIITIHLRRGDKVINNHGIVNDVDDVELVNLNNITQKFIDNCIEQGNNNICFVSDEITVKNQYIEIYKNKANIINIIGDDVSQTYYDLYCMSVSKNIFLSQRFSTFSLLSAMIGKVELYFVYENSKFIENRFDKYYNVQKYNT